MGLTATTVGGYLRDLPADRRVAMARVCSMIRRSARGVRESMRYGLAFYELHGPLFALESTDKDMTLFVAEPEVMEQHKSSLQNYIPERCAIRFTDLNRIPLDSLEKIVRDSVAARRERLKVGSAPTQKELLALWKITEEEAKAPPPIVVIPMGRDETETEEPVPEVQVPEEPKEPVEILRAPTFKDPAMTASSRPKKQTAETEETKAEKPKRKTAARKKTAAKTAEGSETVKKTTAKKTTASKKTAKTSGSAGTAAKKSSSVKKKTTARTASEK